ncbi:hypothetical protein [Tistrella mobilis]|uniref:hypothetical protein n=1 Tax=Tistrella mobilis TaxID=171437 RepID=UPI0035563BC9
MSAGSNAGRGFRYQDHLGALFAIRMVTGEINFHELVPEGSDDYELRANDGRIMLVDAKSTRPGARPRSNAEDIKSFKNLWRRSVDLDANIVQYILVCERSKNINKEKIVPASILFKNSLPEARQSFLMIEPDPLASAMSLLIDYKNVTPISAELTAITLAREVGHLASLNGDRSGENKRYLTVNDIDKIISHVLLAVDSSRLKQLLVSGFCAFVDLDSQIFDDGFYLGVDVQPGHFAAGLAIDRPDATAPILHGLEKTRAVIVTGPSGAGKSGLMWNAVIAARSHRRWLRVNGVDAPDNDALTAFLEAYASVPIGFVVDDVGRGRLEAWNALHSRLASHPNLVLLGSARSEDIALLSSRHNILEIFAKPDENLAKDIWEKMQKLLHTKWPGWREPWNRSNGLLLEYTHILNKGQRLDAIISDQVSVRLREKRDDELNILSATALIAAHGGTVLLDDLCNSIQINRGDMTRALDRLIDEHLLRINEDRTRIVGLHSLRAIAISKVLSAVGYCSEREQAVIALQLAAPDSLVQCGRGIITSEIINETEASRIISCRFSSNSVPSEVSNALRGLREGVLILLARQWVEELEVHGIPPKFATFSVIVGNSPSQFPNTTDLQKVADRGRALMERARSRFHPPYITSIIFEALLSEKKIAPDDLIWMLRILVSSNLDLLQKNILAEICIPFENYELGQIIEIMDAAEAIDILISKSYKSKYINKNKQNLIEIFVKNTPFFLPIVFDFSDEKKIARADIFEAVLDRNENPSERLFRYAKCILRLDPSIDIACVRLVDFSGRKSLQLDAEKRISREVGCPDALVYLNHSVVEAVARAVGTDSWSVYLSRGINLLTQGYHALNKLLDSAMVNSVNDNALKILNSIVDECDNLLAPADPPTISDISSMPINITLTPLQHLVFSLNGRIAYNICSLPEGALPFAVNIYELRLHVEKVRGEPWSLIYKSAPKILDLVEELLMDIEIVALEAAASGEKIQKRWTMRHSSSKSAFKAIVTRSKSSLSRRIMARACIIKEIAMEEIPNIKIYAPSLEDGWLWPSRFVASFQIEDYDNFKNWISKAPEIGERIYNKLSYNEDICVAPVINNMIPMDYAYLLSRRNQHSILSEQVGEPILRMMLGVYDEKILSRTGITLFRRPSEFDEFFIALRDFVGMTALGLGVEGRPKTEVEYYMKIPSFIRSKGEYLLSFFEKITHQDVQGLREILRKASIFEMKDQHELGDISLEEWRDAYARLAWELAFTKC